MIEELPGEQRNRLLQGLSCWRTVMDSENSPVQIHLLQNVIVSQQSDELYFLKPTDLLSSGNPAPPPIAKLVYYCFLHTDLWFMI